MLTKDTLEERKLECELRRLAPRRIKGYYNSTLHHHRMKKAPCVRTDQSTHAKSLPHQVRREISTYNLIAGYLNRIFDLLNQEFFECTLSRSTIAIQSTPRAYGHFSLWDDTWISKKGATFEICSG